MKLLVTGAIANWAVRSWVSPEIHTKSTKRGPPASCLAPRLYACSRNVQVPRPLFFVRSKSCVRERGNEGSVH